jgi:hypothetical protein
MTSLAICLALLGLALVPAGAGAAGHRGGPLIVVKAPAWSRGSVLLHLRARHDLRRDVVRLNGRRVAAATPHRRGERRALVLDRADRLRFGPNRVTVTVRTRGGSNQTIHRRIVVRRDAPLLGIRRPRRVVTGHVARLDARRTGAAHGGALDFRWRVIGAPRGAKVVLRGAHARRPRLIASVPGHYRVALTVSESGAGGAVRDRRATASSASEPGPGATASCSVGGPGANTVGNLPSYGPIASLPIPSLPAGALQVVRGTASSGPEAAPAPSAEPGCATEVTDVEVEPNFEPIGAAIDTRAEVEETAGIRIAGSFYAFPAGEEETGARFVLLDAATLGLIRTEDVALSSFHRAVAAQLVSQYAPDGDVIVVSSCRVRDCPGDTVDSPEGFSAIETFAAGKLTGSTENQGQTLAPNSETQLRGGLEGWLHPGLPAGGDEGALFSYVSPERIAFDTESAAGASSNTISVGAAEYAATLPQYADAGFEVLVLNAAREPVLGTPIAYGTNTADPNFRPIAQAKEEEMAALLGGTNPSDTVFVQSIGHPVPASDGASKLAAALTEIGADNWTFLALHGTGGYAYVGNGAPPQGSTAVRVETTAETSEQAVSEAGGPAGSGGSLHGVLSRNGQSGLSPTLADAVGTPNYEIAQVAYQPRTEWPQTETAGKVEATTYLAKTLKLEGEENGEGLCYQTAQPDFRSIYCDRSLGISATRNELEATKYPTQNVSFSEIEFEEVKKELESELDDLENVREMMKVLEEPFNKQKPEISAQKIAGELIEAMPESTRENGAGIDQLTLGASILDAGSFVPGVGDVLGVFSTALYLADEFSQEEAEPSPPVWKFQIAADKVGATVQSNLETATDHLAALEEILVSDYGKLSTSATDAKTKWAVSDRGLQRETQAIDLGLQRWMWQSIIPAGFELDYFNGVTPGNQGVIHCLTKRNSNWQPFGSSAAPQSVFFPLDRYENGDPQVQGAFAMLAGQVSYSSSVPVNAELAKSIFGPPSEGGAALTQAELLDKSHWTIREPRLIGNGGENEHIEPGWCELREE